MVSLASLPTLLPWTRKVTFLLHPFTVRGYSTPALGESARSGSPEESGKESRERKTNRLGARPARVNQWLPQRPCFAFPPHRCGGAGAVLSPGAAGRRRSLG